METRIPARLSSAEGRRFGLTVGAAFLVLGGALAWRGRAAAPVALALGALLLAAGVIVHASRTDYPSLGEPRSCHFQDHDPDLSWDRVLRRDHPDRPAAPGLRPKPADSPPERDELLGGATCQRAQSA